MLLAEPVKSYAITSPYGERTLNGQKQFHDGVDFISKTGDIEVFAIADGEVCYDFDYYEESQRWTDKRHSAGNYEIIKHIIEGNLYYTRYLHLKENYCIMGQKVKRGDKIGIYANVGYSFGAHLHLDMYDKNWKKIDPSFILNLIMKGE